LYKAIAVEALAAVMIATILSNSKEIQKPISQQEIGKDFDFAAEAEKLQWLYVPDSHKKTE
jgi:hypothetical protein